MKSLSLIGVTTPEHAVLYDEEPEHVCMTLTCRYIIHHLMFFDFRRIIMLNYEVNAVESGH